jgi:hypothetical protein
MEETENETLKERDPAIEKLDNVLNLVRFDYSELLRRGKRQKRKFRMEKL